MVRPMLIVVANTKGGVGKSTLAVHLAAWLHEQGHSVLLVDCDVQHSSSEWAKEAVPGHVRGNLGMAIALHEMALQWGYQPYMVAQHSYVISGRLAFDAQVYLAVINDHAGLYERLRPDYEGDGEDRVCIVRGHFKGEATPVEYRSPPRKQIIPPIGPKTGRDGTPILGEDRQPVMVRKGSPMWDTDPDRQQFYWTVRGFARLYCSNVMLGIFGRDEMQDVVGIGPESARDVTEEAKALTERLKEMQAREGFNHKDVKAALPKRRPKRKGRR